MKKILYILLISIFLFGVSNRVSAKVVVTSLKEAIDEEIEVFGNSDSFKDRVDILKNADLSNYKETSDKVNVYIFRGNSCPHCLNELVYFVSKLKDYGNYYNIYTYEVWDNNDNYNLLNDVMTLLNDKTNGVPYTVISDKTYSGFSEVRGNGMLEYIISEYNNKNRYDIRDKLKLENIVSSPFQRSNSNNNSSFFKGLIELIVKFFRTIGL